MANEAKVQGLRRITAAIREAEAAETEAETNAAMIKVRKLKKETGGAFAEEWAEAHRRDAAELA
jgi:hypothetical protein